MDAITNIDFSILNFIHTHFTCRFLDFLMPKITALGNGGAIWILASLALICTKKYKANGVIMLICLGVGALVGNIILKPLIARPRPCWINETVSLLISIPRGYSFPSGHTLSSVIGAVSLTIANPKFGFIAIPLAALIAFSRLYLYVHFPSDILAGTVIGIVIAYILWKMFSSLLVKRLTVKKPLMNIEEKI